MLDFHMTPFWNCNVHINFAKFSMTCVPLRDSVDIFEGKIVFVYFETEFHYVAPPPCASGVLESKTCATTPVRKQSF